MLQIADRLFVVDQLGNGRVRAAHGAVFGMRRELYLAEFHRERIVGEQVTREQIAHAENVLDGFHRLQTTDNAAHSANHARLLAGRHGIFRRRFLEHAAVAGALARNVRHELSLKTDDSRMGERLLRHHAGVVDEELRREIVRAIDDEIVILDEVEDVVAGDEGVVRNHLHVGIHRFHRLFRGLHLGLAHILRSVDNLALQIGKVDHVGISNADGAHACCGKVHRHGGPEAASANHEHLRIQELLLTLRAYFLQDDVAGIAF